MNDARKYYLYLKSKGNLENVVNWYAHYLHGTRLTDLVNASQRGIVYNPPGH